MLLNLSTREIEDIRDGIRTTLAFTTNNDLADRLVLISAKLKAELDETPKCPYTHAHTRHWCGYEGCRES